MAIGERLERLTARATRWAGSPAERAPTGLGRAAGSVSLGARAFLHDEPRQRAAALAFHALLALVPVLALVFSVLGGFGARETFIHDTVRPWMDDFVGSSPGGTRTLTDAFAQLLDLARGVDFGAIGLLGLVMLAWLVGLLLGRLESALNEIWGVHQPRTFVRRVVDYAATLLAIPLGIMVVLSVGHMGLIDGAPRFVQRVVVHLVGGTMACVALTGLYIIVPNRRVRFSSAALGGVLAGSLWYVTLTVYAGFQIGVTRYNLLFSGFAAVPLFLVWTFVSFLLILFGAEVAAGHQSPSTVRFRLHPLERGHARRREIAANAIAVLVDAFHRGTGPLTQQEIAERVDAAEPLVEEVLCPFVETGQLLRIADRDAYAVAQPLDAMTLAELLDVIDGHDGAEEAREDAAASGVSPDPSGRRVTDALAALRRSAHADPANLTLGELVPGGDASAGRGLQRPGGCDG